ncbi:MAG: chemotaxis protein CheW [Cellvibrionaceae bacterium]
MNSPVVSSSDNNMSEIPSLLIPMAGNKLVLPTVSVAEMTPYQAPQAHQPVTAEAIPDWYLGSLSWRGVMVPMISYEMLNDGHLAEIRPESQVIILNNTGVSEQLPFLCLPTQGIPRLSRVAVNEISQNTQSVLNEYDQMHVFVAGEEAVIPDVGKLEQTCINLLGY